VLREVSFWNMLVAAGVSTSPHAVYLTSLFSSTVYLHSYDQLMLCGVNISCVNILSSSNSIAALCRSIIDEQLVIHEMWYEQSALTTWKHVCPSPRPGTQQQQLWTDNC